MHVDDRCESEGRAAHCLKGRCRGTTAVCRDRCVKRAGEIRAAATRALWLAARHGAPRACQRGDTHTYGTRSTVVRRSRAAGMIPYCQLVAKCGDLQVQRPRERTRKPNDWRGTTTDDT